MHLVELNPGLPGVSRARIRPLCGEDETLIQQGSREESLQLLRQLLEKVQEGDLHPDSADALPVCDVDRILAVIYQRHLGGRIESVVSCQACREGFDLSFSLEDLMKANDEKQASIGKDVRGPDGECAFRLRDGRRFRLPTTRDLDAVAGLAPEVASRHLRRACVLKGDPEENSEELEEAMAAVGPLLDTDLNVSCPLCQEDQVVRFEMQLYFGKAFAFEKRYLNHEVHQIARAYGWHRSEILQMTRDDRRAHVRMILGEQRTSRRTSKSLS